jgi:hypothetical protein
MCLKMDPGSLPGVTVGRGDMGGGGEVVCARPVLAADAGGWYRGVLPINT